MGNTLALWCWLAQSRAAGRANRFPITDTVNKQSFTILSKESSLPAPICPAFSVTRKAT